MFIYFQNIVEYSIANDSIARLIYSFIYYRHLISGEGSLGFYASAISEDVENESFSRMIGSFKVKDILM